MPAALATVYRSWIASRPDLSPKVHTRLHRQLAAACQSSAFRCLACRENRPRVDPGLGQRHVSVWAQSTDSAMDSFRLLKMCLDYAADAGQLSGKNPAGRSKFPPMRHTPHIYLTTAEVAALTLACGSQGDIVSLLPTYPVRFGELTGDNVEDVDLKARRIRVRRSMTQVGGMLLEGNPKSEAGKRACPIPERVDPRS